jgi:hypothetical protein
MDGDHAITPVKGSAYSMEGANTGLQANLLNPYHYPVEALCVECGHVIRCEHMHSATGGWVHIRKPGETASIQQTPAAPRPRVIPC